MSGRKLKGNKFVPGEGWRPTPELVQGDIMHYSEVQKALGLDMNRMYVLAASGLLPVYEMDGDRVVATKHVRDVLRRMVTPAVDAKAVAAHYNLPVTTVYRHLGWKRKTAPQHLPFAGHKFSVEYARKMMDRYTPYEEQRMRHRKQGETA